MLQALRANDDSPKFHTAYLAFEVKFLSKLMQRRQILAGHKQLNEKGELIAATDNLEFIDGDDEDGKNDVEGEVKAG